jgi:hypothetical protein
MQTVPPGKPFLRPECYVSLCNIKSRRSPRSAYRLIRDLVSEPYQQAYELKKSSSQNLIC